MPRQVWGYSPSVARIIPGLRTSAQAETKKPSHSVRVDGSLWQGENRSHQAIRQRALQKIASVAAPMPSCAADASRLGTSILADSTVVFLSMAIVHIPPCCRALDWGRTGSVAALLWTHVRNSDLGLAIIYAALITLLIYTERQSVATGNQSAQLYSVSKAVLWATLLLSTGITLSGAGTMSAGMLVASAILNCGGMLAWRFLASRRRVSSNSNLRNVLVVGAGRLGSEIAAWLEKREPTRVVKGFLDQTRGADPRILGTIENLPEIARAQFADEVIVALPDDREMAKTAVFAALRNHLDVRVVPDLFGCPPDSLRVENIGRFPVISLHEESVPQLGLMIKRVLDCVAASLALLLLSPFFVVISVLIKLDSPGPTLYLGERVGRKGRRFLCCKFRTMNSNAEALKSRLRARNERVGPMFKITDDPRITRIGRLLRRYSLDELPQLWNVLRGEMSLVGPRPHPVDDFAGYQLDHLRRLDMTPGLTGLWQITARNDPSFQKSMTLDLEYIERWSLWLDLRILLKTIPVVLAGTGA